MSLLGWFTAAVSAPRRTAQTPCRQATKVEHRAAQDGAGFVASAGTKAIKTATSVVGVSRNVRGRAVSAESAKTYAKVIKETEKTNGVFKR